MLFKRLLWLVPLSLVAFPVSTSAQVQVSTWDDLVQALDDYVAGSGVQIIVESDAHITLPRSYVEEEVNDVAVAEMVAFTCGTLTPNATHEAFAASVGRTTARLTRGEAAERSHGETLRSSTLLQSRTELLNTEN